MSESGVHAERDEGEEHADTDGIEIGDGTDFGEWGAAGIERKPEETGDEWNRAVEEHAEAIWNFSCGEFDQHVSESKRECGGRGVKNPCHVAYWADGWGCGKREKHR